MGFTDARADASACPFGGCAASRYDCCARRHVPHGIRPSLSGRSAGSSRHRRQLLHRPHAGDERAVQAIRQRDPPRHLCRDRARSEGLSRIAAAHDLCRLAGVSGAVTPRRPAQLGRMVVAHEGRQLAASVRPEEQHPAASTIIRWCTSRSRTRSPMRIGPARTCRPRRNGSSPRAAGSTAPNMPGAMSSRPAAGTWPTPGRARFRTRTISQTDLRAPRR